MHSKLAQPFEGLVLRHLGWYLLVLSSTLSFERLGGLSTLLEFDDCQLALILDLRLSSCFFSR
ncbi:hypothetical protein P4204_21545 [Pseudomonas aeruginosa]|nr:hypothetical protein [Pseudomonas aeruginosa]MDF5878409.1 hypothetical protein [Pseudomonas aeruginosa]